MIGYTLGYQMRKEEGAEPKVREGSSMKKRKDHTKKKSSKSLTFTEAVQGASGLNFYRIQDFTC